MQTTKRVKKHRAPLKIFSENRDSANERTKRMRRHRTIGNDLDRSLAFFLSFFSFFVVASFLCARPVALPISKPVARKNRLRLLNSIRRGLSRARGRVQPRCHVRTRDDESSGRWKSSTGWIVRLFPGFPIMLHIRAIASSPTFSNFFLFVLQISVVL